MRRLALWRHFTVVAVAGSALPFTLLGRGEQHVSSLTSVPNASTPLFAALFVAAFLGERLRAFQIAGLLPGFVGMGPSRRSEGRRPSCCCPSPW
jgi:drug/metabolite transporter (DMT)-like permease